MQDACPKISIVTVVFEAVKANRREALCQCLDSVASQDYPNIEHIVVDGASADGTLEMLREYESSGRIRLVSEPDSGIFNAMNKGLRLAEGEYVAYLNSDDFYSDATAVSTVARALGATGADFTMAPCNLLENDGTTAFSPLYIDRAFNVAPCYHLCVFAKRSLLQKLGGFDERYKIASDSDLIARMLLSGARVAVLWQPFATFRTGGASVDASACRRECEEFFKNDFCAYAGITEEQAARMVWSDYLPWKLLFKFCMHGDRRVVRALLKNRLRKVLFFRAARKLMRVLRPRSRCKAALSALARRIYVFVKTSVGASNPALCANAATAGGQRPAQRHTVIGKSTVLMPTTSFRNPFDNPITVGEECILANSFIFESDRGEIRIGNRVFINGLTQLISRSSIVIEDNVTIAWGCMLYDHNSHSLDPTMRRKDIVQELADYRETGDFTRTKDWSVVKSKPIRICHDAWLGFNVTVLAGVTIGECAVIGAQSVVRTDIPPYAIAYGNPAVVVGYIRA